MILKEEKEVQNGVRQILKTTVIRFSLNLAGMPKKILPSKNHLSS